MKITSVLLLAFCLQVSARTVGQKVSVSLKNVRVQEVLREVIRQAGVSVLYDEDAFEGWKPVTVVVSNASVQEVLDICFKGSNINYVVEGDTFVIRRVADEQAKPEVSPSNAQLHPPVEVQGRVINEKGEPLVGVTVSIRETNKATSTDNDGRFTIRADRETVLVFTYAGFVDKEVLIDKRTNLEIQLDVKTTGMEEVVVVAYGKQKKISVTGAIASIQTKEIKQSPAANLAVTLAGRLPGLTAIQRSGEPGRDITQLLIRGQGTINAQSPIILVDGIERDLTYVNPNEIESVTILKDASSTAIFGIRGANGVIMITTRRGTSETPEINLTAESGAQEFTRFMSPVNSHDYATLRNLSQRNDGLPEEYPAEAIEHFEKGDDPARYPNTNMRDILLKKYALMHRYNLNVSGAGKAVKYFVSAGYLNQGGPLKVEKGLPYDPNFFLRRYNFRSNIDVQLNKSLKAYLNLAGYLEVANKPYAAGEPDAGVIAEIISWGVYDYRATVPGPLTPDGKVITFGTHPYPGWGMINRTGYVQSTRSNVTATYGMEQDLNFITRGLTAKAALSFDSKTTNELIASKSYEKVVQVIDPDLTGVDGRDSVHYIPFNTDLNTPLSISGARYFTTLVNLQGSVNYQRTFGKHAISGLLLYQQQKTVIDFQLPYNLKGLASRLTYGFDNRYYVEFNAGYNGSEQFAPGKRFGFFPAVSGAWIISHEAFLNHSKVFNLLKLRGSYGKVGNDRIGDRRFLYLDEVNVAYGSYYPGSSLGNGQQITINLLKNENLQWEIARKANIGMELGLYNGLNLVIDVFKERRDNVLRSRGTIPVLNGYPLSAIPPMNIGIIENGGYEIELNYTKRISKDFSLLSKLNLNFARNKQLFADEPLLPEDFTYRYRETGFRIGQPFGYVVERFFTDSADIAKSPAQTVGGHGSMPGDFKYTDLNGDGVVTEKDQAPIGYSTIPEYQFGAALNLTYKNLDVSLLFQGVTNVYNYYAGRGTFPLGNFVERHLQSWTPERAANGEPITYPRLSTLTSPNEIPNSYFIIDASYVRLKNVEIGYTFPERWSKKIGSNHIRVYANGLNLYTWDRLPTKEFDPELVGELSYPLARIVNFGANISF